MSYLWWDIVDVVVPPVSSFLLSLPGEVVDVVGGGVPPGPQAGWDVVDLLGGLADSAPVAAVMLVSQDGGRHVIHILGDGRLVVVVIEARRDGGRLEFGKVGRHVVGLFSDWLSIRDVFTDRRREVVDLKREREGEKCSNII